MERWGTAVVIGALAAIFACVGAANAEDAAAEPVAAGMRVYIDPETGDFGAAPEAEPQEAPATEDALQRSRSTDDLVVEVNPAGGYTVDLKRRFGGVVRATAGERGTDVECESADAAGKD